MTTGSQLKTSLGLDAYPNVLIHRYISSRYRFYFIYFDSRWPSRLITYQEIRTLPYIGLMLNFPDFQQDRSRYTPTMHIEDWNGDPDDGVFFTFDLSGRYGELGENRKHPIVPKFSGRLQEFVTLSDLNTDQSISDFTSKTRKERNKALSTENKLAKLVDVILDTVKDYVTFVFHTGATTPIYRDDHKFKRTKPKDNHRLASNPEKRYEIYIRVLDFFSWLEAQDTGKAAITRKDIKEVLSISNIQVYSTSPSFHWQGMNYNLSILDGSVYPTDIEPQRWDKVHGDDAFLDKHLYGLMRSIAFFENQMAAMLTKRLRSREII
jgi:hypothetical protein